jgi:hypothetical protein
MALSKGDWAPISGMRENWLIQVHETDGSGFKSFSFFDQTVNSVAYSGIIMNSPSIRESINIFRSSFAVSNLTLELQDDSDLRQDFLFGSNYYLNGDVKVFSCLESGTVANLNNTPQIYQGRLESVSHDDSTVTLNIVAKRPYDNVTVPNVYSAENVAAPLAYGDYSGHNSIKTNGTPNNWRSIPFTKYDSTGMSFVSGTLAETSQEVSTYVPNYDMFIKYHGGTYNNATAGDVKVFKIPVSGKHIYQVAPVSNSAITTSSEITAANLSNTYDLNDATEGTLTFPIGSVSAATYSYKERYVFDSALEIGQRAKANYDVTGYNNLANVNVQLILLDADGANAGTGIEAEIATNASDRTSYVIATADAVSVDVLVKFEYSSGASPAAVVEIKEVFAYITKFKEDVEFIYSAADGETQGYKGSSTRVSKIHEAHRSFVHNILGVDTDGGGTADPDGWSDLNTARASWTCRYNLLQSIPAKKFLDKIQFEGGFVSTFSSAGDIKYIFAKDSYSSANHTLDKNDLTDISYAHTPLSSLITDILVNYDPHPGKARNYRSQTTASESTIRGNYNIPTAKVVNYNLDALTGGIGTDLTPASPNAGFINYYGNLRSSPRVIMKAGIVNPTLFDMELGDICTFSSMIPATAFNKSFSGTYFMVTSLTRSSGKLQAEFVDVTAT